MRKPRLVKLQILGIYQNDEYDYFTHPEDYLNTQLLFPLNKFGENYGIIISRLEFFLRKHYLQEGTYLNGKLIFSFFNYQKQEFINMNDVMVISTNYVELQEQFFTQDSQQSPLIVKIKVQLYYNEYRKIKQFLDDIQSQKLILIDNMQLMKNELIGKREILQQFASEVKQLKQKYPIKISYPQIDVAFLYSHPVFTKTKDKDLIVTPVSYYQEITNIKSKTQQENKMMRCLVTQATKENLKWVLKYDPKILHIMSHGDKDKETEEYFLQFENACYDDRIYTEEFSQIMKKSMKNLSLVILSCCHSGEIATMISQYAPTIAVQAEVKMLDVASIHYSGALYQQLLKRKSLKDSHEIAKQITVNILHDKIFSCCCSHLHKEICYYKFCFHCGCDCECKNKKYLLHEWSDNHRCKIEVSILALFHHNPGKLEMCRRKLDQYAKFGKGEIKACCCELSERFESEDDNVNSIEHNESEKFQIFPTQSADEKLLHEIEEGTFVELNKLALQEQYDFIGWKKEIVLVYNKLGEQLNTKSKQILFLFREGENNMLEAVTEFALKVTKYFIEREVKFYRKDDSQIIGLVHYQLDQIDDQLELFELNMNMIIVISNATFNLFKQKEEKLKSLNKKGAMLIITSDSQLKQMAEQNSIVLTLQNWIKKDDSPNLLNPDEYAI